MPSSTGATIGPAAVADSRIAREPALLSSPEAVSHPVRELRRRQQRAGYVVSGRPCPLSPLTDTATYYMAQEPLVNCTRRVPEVPCQVRITYQQGCAEIAASNRHPPNAEACQTDTGSKGGGYDLSDMAERAALAGAELITGPSPGGGWRNRLVTPVPPVSADGSHIKEEAVIS